MPSPDDRSRRRSRRRARRAWIRARIVGYLRDRPGWHGTAQIWENAPGMNQVHPAEILPELRRLVDRGMVTLSYADQPQPACGFDFRSRFPVFAHWRALAPTHRPLAGGGGGG